MYNLLLPIFLRKINAILLSLPNGRKSLRISAQQIIHEAVGCNMKKIAIIILTLSFNLGFGQVEIPFFEQIAFDFYKDSLLTKFPVEKRIKIPVTNQSQK